MKTRPYDREKALTYAHTWAFARNPHYYDFERLGGDCTNFASQVLYAGAGIMNPSPVGWYYYNLNRRAPAWTGVEFLYRFLVKNRGTGPVAVETDASEAVPGDLIQISFDGIVFAHSPVIVSTGDSPSHILVATHSYDTDYRPLESYPYARVRFLHITHVNLG